MRFVGPPSEGIGSIVTTIDNAGHLQGVDGSLLRNMGDQADVASLHQNILESYLSNAILNSYAAGQITNGGFDAFTSDTIGANSTGYVYDASTLCYNNGGMTSIYGTGAEFVSSNTVNINNKESTFGSSFRTVDAGVVTSARFNVFSVISVGCDGYVAQIWTNSANKPGVQVGGSSNPCLADNTPGVKTFTWSTNAPELAQNTTYWVVFVAPTNNANFKVTRAPNTSTYLSGRSTTYNLPTTICNDTWDLCCDVAVVSAVTSMTLITNTFNQALVATPTTIKTMLYWKDRSNGQAIINTDLKISATRNGNAYTLGTLSTTGVVLNGYTMLFAAINVVGQGNGNSVKLKIECTNKAQSIKALSMMTK